MFANIVSTGGSSSASAELVAADNQGAGGTFVHTAFRERHFKEIPIVGAAGSATWEITSSDPYAIDSVQVSVIVQGAGQAPTPAQISQIGITLTLGPISTVNTSTQSAPLPRFIDTSVQQLLTNLHVFMNALLGVLVGSNVPLATFTNSITNASSTTAFNVVVHDFLPATLQFQGCSVNGANCPALSGPDLQIPIGNLDGGGSAVVTINATVATNIPGTSTPLPDGTPITNTVSATADQQNSALGSTTSTFIYSSCATCVPLTVASNPPGLTVLLDGAEHQQTTLQVNQNSSHLFYAVSPQSQNGQSYAFVNWNNNAATQQQSLSFASAATVTANFAAPALSVALHHSGSFNQGESNATYAITVTNLGTVATSGAVTVTEMVPSGLILQSLVGGGNWTCATTPTAAVPVANSCIRNDVLGAGSNYEPIVATVSVGPSASSPQMNAVSVSGGGSASANASDSTIVLTAPTLQSIAVMPASPSIAKGKTQQFTATGTYSDNSTQNLTSQVTWNSSNTAIATITSAGLATGAGLGPSNITASLNGVTSPPDILTVTAATLQSIAVTPASPSIAKGKTQQFTATGTYSDNSTQSLTSQVTWNSSNPAIATITSAGLATGAGLGPSNITAALNGVTSPTDVLTVTAVTLQSIAVTPASPTITIGATEQFTATGTYSDNSTQSLTSQVTWNSSNSAIATITGSRTGDGGGSGGEQHHGFPEWRDVACRRTDSNDAAVHRGDAVVSIGFGGCDGTIGRDWHLRRQQ